MAAISMVGTIAWIALSRNGIDPSGKPLGTDFLSFWAASKIALSGPAKNVYAVDLHYAAQQSAFPGAEISYAAYFYPPVFLLICFPLALLPYFVSLAVWLAVTGYAYWRVVRQFVFDANVASVALLAFPAVLVNIGHGQNGFLTAALFGGAVLACEKRPILAGVLFGCLAFKPHLAILIPIALAARGAWRTFIAAAVTSVSLVLFSVAVFGIETWKGFLAVSPLARATLEQELVGSAKMQSVFAAVRVLHGSVFAAYAIQTVVAIAACALLLLLARHRAKPLTQGVALVSAAMLATPFLLDYDLTLLAIPLAWLFNEGRRTGFLAWEKILLLAAFVLPLVSRLAADRFGLPLGPPVLAAVFLLILRRGLHEGPQKLSRTFGARSDAADYPEFQRASH
jgi:alpha-1,2-mannosyltransferase